MVSAGVAHPLHPRLSTPLLLFFCAFAEQYQSYGAIVVRVARCLVFNWTVWYFGPLSFIKIIIIHDNACVNSSIFCATDIGTVNVRYF